VDGGELFRQPACGEVVLFDGIFLRIEELPGCVEFVAVGAGMLGGFFLLRMPLRSYQQ
jgi:hypothetical protein